MKIRMIVYEIFIFRPMESKLVLEPVLQNGLDDYVPAALRATMYAVTRGMHQYGDGSWGSPSYSDIARYPGNGLRASGNARVKGLEYAGRFGLLQSPLIVTTSGCPKPDDPNAPHYGNTYRSDLIRRGVNQNGSTERTMLVQGDSLDTIGEIAMLPPYLRSLCNAYEGLLELLQMDGVTVYSSFEQGTRIALLQVLVSMQADDQSIAERSIDLLREDLNHNPTIAYVRVYAQEIINRANASLIDQEHAVKALALAHMSPDETCCQINLQNASRALFINPRFAPWFAQHTPNLAEDLQWMHFNKIKVQNLSTEEIMLYLQKNGHRIGAKLRENWLDLIWHVTPEKNAILPTMLAELGGVYDLYNSQYYPVGKIAEDKAAHTQILMEQFGIIPPQPHP